MRIIVHCDDDDDDVDGHVDDGVQCWVRACVHRQSVRGGKGGGGMELNKALKGRLTKM